MRPKDTKVVTLLSKTESAVTYGSPESQYTVCCHLEKYRDYKTWDALLEAKADLYISFILFLKNLCCIDYLFILTRIYKL